MGSSGSRGLSSGWDVGELTTENAEKRLLFDAADTGDFLVRWDRGLNCHVLSIRSAPFKVKHFPINKDVSEGVGAALYSIDDEYGVYTEEESPIKGFQYASIEEMLENFVKGGPYAKIAYKHFGGFLLRVSKAAPVRQTAPPTAFADAQGSMFGGGRGTSMLSGKGHTSDTGFGRRMSFPGQAAGALNADRRSGSVMSRGGRQMSSSSAHPAGLGVGTGLGGASGRDKLNNAGSSRSPSSMQRSRSHPNVKVDRASSRRGSAVSRTRKGSITTPPSNAPEPATYVNDTAQHTYTNDGGTSANAAPGGTYDDMQFGSTYDDMQFGNTYDVMTFGKVGEGEGEGEGVELYDAPAFAQPQGKRRSVTSVGSVRMWGGENTEAEDDSDEETFGFN